MNWEKIAALRTPLLMILSLIALVGGVGTGVFLLSAAAGWITVGILGCLSLAFLAYVCDPSAASGALSNVRAPDRVMVR